MRAPDSGVRRLRLWTSADVCAFLGLGKNAPADLVGRGELRGYRIGRRPRVDPADVRAIADRYRVEVSGPLATMVARRTT